ncbi:MAG: peptidoglycan DD-metalloendopeptidase family protein [Actinomycetota bacterium]
MRITKLIALLALLVCAVAASPALGAQDLSDTDQAAGPEPEMRQQQPQTVRQPAKCDITGTTKADELSGGGGDDTICGLGGNDTIDGGTGNDLLYGGGGRDNIRGGPHGDTISGGLGIDTCRQNGGSGPLRSCEWPNPLKACPVPGGTITDSFGDPRSGGRTHEGIDIIADKGDPVKATFAGKMENGSNELGGKTVYLHGDQGYTYNAHLSRRAEERRVKPGETIGFVGNTGNAQGGVHHLHFEWHPGDGKAVDPYRYVVKACKK